MVARLRDHGYRMTPQRLAIVRVLAKSEGHPSAEQIYRSLLLHYPMLSPATVYKTLDTLKQLGEVLELEFRDSPNRYDGSNPRPHPHLMCTECGALQDLELENLDATIADASKGSGYTDLRHRLDVYGRCPHCDTATAG